MANQVCSSISKVHEDIEKDPKPLFIVNILKNIYKGNPEHCIKIAS